VEPFPLLKDGRIGARLIKKLAKDTGGTPGEIELAIDLAVRTDLLTVDEPEEPPRRRGKAPKPEPATLVLNTVISRPAPALLYRYLLTMWWEPPPIQFEPEDDRARALVLRLLARLEPGTGIPDVAALTRLVAWHAPTMPHETLADDVRLVIEEAELLGLVVSGAVTTTGRALLEPDNAALIKATDELVSHARTTALFGTDLTAIVPGSPDAGLAALLDRSADRETQGTATSWRFSPTSVRRAFDQGATATVLLDELSSVAQGELPQPLVYLINDVARRHGEAQVLDVASVVVGTDPALLTEIAAHRKLAKLQLRAVAPTVLTSTVDANGTLEALRDAGYAPTRHHADGSIVVPARESGSATTVVRDPEPGDAEFVPPPDPLEHAARLLAAPPTSPGLQRGQVTRAMSDRYQGRLTPMRQQLCWQLEAGIPAAVTYRADGETERLVVIYPEIDGDVLDVWSLNERTYRRLELSRIDLDQGSTDVSLA
ncbi:MAG TPA: helicase-associated domain-containing protein, partial [Amycolatopsis sp.]|nr:helicase-associated domain-containing protein [Amycolatopsis sp.]